MTGAVRPDCLEPDCICRRDFDIPYTDSLYEDCLGPLARDYFRTELIGADRIPQRDESEPPLIFALNHSGMSFPWDSLMFKQALLPLYRERHGEQGSRRDHVRALAARELSASRLMCLFGIEGWWHRMGTVDATLENFDTMMRHPWDLIFFPEGTTGIGKGFQRRYRLTRFKKTIAKIAVRHEATIVPVHVVGAEWLNPFAYQIDAVDRWARRRGIPFLPLGPTTLAWLLFPLAFYGVLPARLRFVIGEPVRLRAPVAFEDMRERHWRKLTDELQDAMQEELLDCAARHGRKPYDLAGLARAAWRARRRLRSWSPLGWPRLFLDHARRHGLRAGPVWPFYLPVLGWRWIIR